MAPAWPYFSARRQRHRHKLVHRTTMATQNLNMHLHLQTGTPQRQALVQQFCAACARGNLPLAQQLHQTHQFTPTELHAQFDRNRGHPLLQGNGALKVACQHGRLDVVAWLAQTFSAASPADWAGWALVVAGEYGQLAAAQKLQAVLAFAPGAVAKHADRAFFDACVNGHRATAEWMYATYKLTRANVVNLTWYVLRESCAHGQVDVVKWLCETFTPTKADVLGSHNDGAFAMACENGHLNVAQYLQRQYAIADADVHRSFMGNLMGFWFAKSRMTNLLCHVTGNGHLGMLKWLCTLYGVTRREVLWGEGEMFTRACAYGHLATAKWLYGHYNLTLKDMNYWRIINGAKTWNRPEVLAWLRTLQ